MRIALITDWYLPRLGGIELYLDGLATHLLAAGFDVDVMTPVPGPAVVNGVPVTRLCNMSRPNGGFRFPPPRHAANGPDLMYLLDLFAGRHHPGVLDRLRTALLAKPYDVVHVHLGNTPFAYLAVNICRTLGLPVVATFHSMLSGIERPLAGLSAKLLNCRLWPDKVVLTAVSTKIAVNRAVMFGAAPFTLLHNALDGTWAGQIRLRRATSSGQSSRLELTAIMRLHPRKRPGVLLQAVSALKQAMPNQPIRLRIAGDGAEQAGLERQIDRLGLHGQVQLCGQLPRAEIANLLAEADLFLTPTLLEAFGIAALEARSAGVPVLSMRNAGSADFLTDGRDGMIVENDQAFSASLIEFAQNPVLRARLTQGAEQPLPGFSWPDLIAACQAAYAKAEAMTLRLGPQHP